MLTYISLVDVTRDVQNIQELASIWGDVRSELEQFEAELESTYAVLGERDFVVIFQVPDRDKAFQVALALRRRGLDMQTMEIVPTDHFAELVEDI